MFPIPLLLAALKRLAQPLLLAALVALAAWCFWQQWQLGSERRAHAKTKAEYAQQIAAMQAAALDAAAKYRQQEQDWQRTKAEAEAIHAKNLERERAARLRAVAESDRLRDEAAAYAAGGGAAADDTVTACRERAAALGQLLGEVERAGAAMAQDADRHADEVRLLLEAWPR